jgi:adenylylsulfate kinase-like enzyme
MMTGVSQRFEEPKNPDIIIDTTKGSIDVGFFKLLNFINGS